MRTIAKIWFGVAALVLVPSAVYAQASITGVVRDTSGAVLPGVTVEAASPALIEKVRTVVTDGTGQYRIVDLRPGTYTVTVTLAGFNTVKREGIELTGSFTATVNAELRVGALEETITVTGETPVVDVQSTTRQRVIDHEVIDVIPTGRSERNLALLVPGMAATGGSAGGQQDVGGALNETQTSMVAHGSRPGDHRITLNGVSVGVAILSGNNSSKAANPNSYEEIVVDSAAVSAEHAPGGPRINYIPREGGNAFKGLFFGNFANDAMQGSNYTEELKARGLRVPGALQKMFDINPGFGGPIKRDRLWFYTSIRYNSTDNYPAAIFFNLNANNPNAWTYAPDSSRRPVNHIVFKDAYVRLTWQATSKNKIGVIWSPQEACFCSAAISATIAPEAAVIRPFPREIQALVDWTAPLTNRWLLDAAIVRVSEYTAQKGLPGTDPSMISVTDQALANLTYRAISAALRNTEYHTRYLRASASYITGAHAFKVGFILGRLDSVQTNFDHTQPVNYRFNNGVPNQMTLRATPNGFVFVVNQDSGVYAQDKWTVGRLTLSYGIRYDYFKDSFPAQSLGPGPLVPDRNLTFPAAPGVSWHDITPKSGASYDLLGDGRTALKITLNKYLQAQGQNGPFGTALAPISRVVDSTTRSWNDANRNYVPECDLTNPAANGECGPMANRNFGRAVPGATYDPDTLTGWGKRGYNWEFSTGVQREILPQLSVDVSYFRRWVGNFIITDNRTVAASDYTSFSLPIPTVDPRLPAAGGVITGFYDINPAKFGVPADNYITFAKNYGKQIAHWNGFDVTTDVRALSGVRLQGGLSIGRTTTDNCEVAATVPEMLLGMALFNETGTASGWTPLQYCHQQERFLTQVKFTGAYTVPRVDVLISGALQSLPGPRILASYAAPNAVVAPSLGRNLAGGAQNVTLNLVAPGTLYGERATWLDLRFGKILRYGRTRTSMNVDLFNVLNANPVLVQSNTFGGAIPWQAPQAILVARFFKISGQIDF